MDNLTQQTKQERRQSEAMKKIRVQMKMRKLRLQMNKLNQTEHVISWRLPQNCLKSVQHKITSKSACHQKFVVTGRQKKVIKRVGKNGISRKEKQPTGLEKMS